MGEIRGAHGELGSPDNKLAAPNNLILSSTVYVLFICLSLKLLLKLKKLKYNCVDEVIKNNTPVQAS